MLEGITVEIWYFHQDNEPPQQLEQITQLPTGGFIWLDFSPDEVMDAVAKIKSLTGITLHDSHIADCLNPQHPCFYDSMQYYDLLIFRDLQYPTTANVTLQTTPVAFILFEQLLVTINGGDNEFPIIKTRYQELGRRYPPSPKLLLLSLLNAMIDSFLSLRTPLSIQFADWQSKLLDENKRFSDWVSLQEFKTNINQLEMLCEEQQDVLEQWRQNMGLEINENFAVRLNDLSDHIKRILRFTQRLKLELDSLVQLHYSIIGQRTNEVMRTLTLLAAIFMPLTLITGIYGMNFDFIPILHYHFGYYAILVLMAILAVTLISIFRFKKWL